MKIVSVAIFGSILRTLDYLYEDSLEILVGARVWVPLGKSKKLGLVIGFPLQSSCPIEKLKKLDALLDTEPLLNDELMQLANWISRYYHHPLGETLSTLLPNAYLRGQPLCSPKKAKPPQKNFPSSPLTVNLNADQQAAVNQVSFDAFCVYLLEGVTGSGKTEVYLKLIEEALHKGHQALVLVPEIGLTPQTLLRFQERLSTTIATFHSKMTASLQHHCWYQVKTGEVRVVIGTRSSVFLPFAKLGVIVVDEEHDLSYKQQNGLRYSAKEVAIKRAQLHQAPIILGSATPALETFYQAVHTKKFKYLQLQQRAGSALFPKVYLIDMRQQMLLSGISKPMLQAASQHLEKKGQVLFFLNRRGYAPVMMCHDCGWAATCESCERYLTVHHAPLGLSCHHCLTTHPLLALCPKCQAKNSMINIGLGTERLEEALAETFSGHKVLRIDRSSTERKGKFSEFLSEIHSGEAHILVGTQMIAKGHHFPNITMVGIIDVDAGLFASDFRALERTGQIILQVAGRSGRAERPGEVYIQTHQPNHELLNVLLTKGYPSFSESLLLEREKSNFPPYSYLAVLRVEALSKEACEEFLGRVKKVLKQTPRISVLGPAPGLTLKKNNYFRMQLLLMASQRQWLHEAIHQELMPRLSFERRKTLRWSLDIDPQEIN